MLNLTRLNESIYRLTVPYKGIYTTVYTVNVDGEVLLFDCASYDEDITEYILPFFEELKITPDMLKYVYISHNHHDHAGGLSELMKRFPKARIISRSEELKEKFKGYTVIRPEDGDVIQGVLRAVTVPGHTPDCCALYDTRTKTMISGDCLQLYGIYGSGKWASNVTLIKEHVEAVKKLHAMDIKQIYAAHDYHPCGYCYIGKDAVQKALKACVDALYDIKDMIRNNPDAGDEDICKIHDRLGLPSLAAHVVAAVRREL